MNNINDIDEFCELLAYGSSKFGSYYFGDCIDKIVSNYHKENFGIGFFEYE